MLINGALSASLAALPTGRNPLNQRLVQFFRLGERTTWRSALGRFLGLILVTVFALAVMLASGFGMFFGKDEGGGDPPDVSSEDLLKAPAPVFVRPLREERIDVINTYSGMIRPQDRYSIGFEVAGRVEWIQRRGGERAGELIDIGYRVSKDEELARLDDGILNARIAEVKARLRLAEDNLARAKESRRRVARSVTDAELGRLESEVNVAKAQMDVAEEQLTDVILRSPVDGVLARRMVEEGETVAANQVLFQVVTVDQVVLVVGVPESRLPEITRRRREVIANNQQQRRARELGQSTAFQPDDLQFRAKVRQLGKDRFGRPWPQREARVYHIGETADDRTGLFEVEVLVDNQDGWLKPGYIALADIIIDRIDGYRVPTSSVQFRDRQAFLFTAQQESGGDAAAGEHLAARRHLLKTYIEQQDAILIPTRFGEPAVEPPLPGGEVLAVVKGQHRLVDGRRVEIMQRESDGNVPAAPEPVRGPSAVESLGVRP